MLQRKCLSPLKPLPEPPLTWAQLLLQTSEVPRLLSESFRPGLWCPSPNPIPQAAEDELCG
jgi:hypothetical protein